MALQPRSMTHQAYAQFLGHSVSTSKEIHLMLTNIHANHKKGEKPVGVNSAFTVGNYHCKPLMTDVIVIHRVKKNMALQPKSMTLQAYAQFWGHPVSRSKEVHLMLTNIHTNHKKEETPMGAKNPFTMGNYHCKPVMTDVILIYKKQMALQPK